MNRRNESFVTAARLITTQLWTRLVDVPGGRFADRITVQRDWLLDLLFQFTPPGRWLFQRTSANDWTTLRLVTCWLPALLVKLQYSHLALAAWMAIWLTDIIDGYFARRKHQSSAEGMTYETIVDTVFQLVTFATVALAYPTLTWYVVGAGGLELMRLGGGRLFQQQGFIPDPNRTGRWKTVAYVAAIGCQLLQVSRIAQGTMLVGLGFSVYSQFQHYREYRQWKQRH